MEQAGPSNGYLYNPRLKERARKLRGSMTKSEAALWKYALRKGQMLGLTFNRQRPVMDYIADFMCKELLLIIEVDGASHQVTGQAEKDVIRQQRLESAGFRVIRFTATEVLTEMEEVKFRIQRQCEALILE